MDVVTKEVLNELINFTSPNTISIYMPTHPGTQDVRQDPIRLKNVINKAKRQLSQNGVDEGEAQRILAPATALIDDIDFWQLPGSGTLLFLANGFSQILKVPLEVDELVVVTDRFHLKRFIPYFSENQRFYILAVSKSSVRFMECTKNACSSLTLEGLPESMEDAIGSESDTSSIAQSEHGSGTRGSRGSGGGTLQGQSYAKEDERSKISRYMTVMAKDLHNRLKDDTTPLVFAGDSQYYPIFKDANTYPHMISGFVEGSHENLSDTKIHSEAWKVIEPFFEQNKKEAINRFKSIEGTMNISEQLNTAAAAAFQGRIETLIVPMGIRLWGKFDSSTGDIELHTDQHPGDEDLLDFTAVHTLRNGGKVYAVKPEEMPNGGKIAAIFRF